MEDARTPLAHYAELPKLQDRQTKNTVTAVAEPLQPFQNLIQQFLGDVGVFQKVLYVKQVSESALEYRYTSAHRCRCRSILESAQVLHARILEPPFYMWGFRVCTRIQDTTPEFPEGRDQTHKITTYTGAPRS